MSRNDSPTKFPLPELTAMCQTIEAFDPHPGAGEMAGDLRECCETLIEKSWVGEGQLELLEASLKDLRMICRDRGAIGS